MTAITASEARANLYRLIDEAASSHQPLLISGKRNKAVLVSEEDWTAIQETLFLLSVPGMRESIREGMDTPVVECDEYLDWRLVYTKQAQKDAKSWTQAD
jgi:antitoxin YefM